MVPLHTGSGFLCWYVLIMCVCVLFLSLSRSWMLKKSRFPRLACVQVQVRFAWVCICVWCDFCLLTCEIWRLYGRLCNACFSFFSCAIFVLFLTNKRSPSDGLQIPFTHVGTVQRVGMLSLCLVYALRHGSSLLKIAGNVISSLAE